LPELSAGISTAPIHVGHSYSIRKQDEPGGVIPLPTWRGLVECEVAKQAAHRFGFLTMDECHAFHLPQLKQYYASWPIYDPNPQDLAMDMKR
jgi:hypothetical protein